MAVRRVGRDKRDVRLGVVLVCLELADAAVITVEGAVIGREDDERIPPQVEPIQHIEEAPQPAIQENHLGGIARAVGVELVFGQVLAPGDVGRSRVHAGYRVASRIKLLEDVFRGIPRLVRVEDVQVQVEILMAPVPLQPCCGPLEDLRAEVIPLRLADEVDVAPVSLILAEPVARRTGEGHGVCAIGIRLTAAHEVEAGVAHVIVAGALLPQVEVIGDEIADPIPVRLGPLYGLVRRTGDLARQVEVFLLQRPPAALQKLVAAGIEIAPRGHARR